MKTIGSCLILTLALAPAVSATDPLDQAKAILLHTRVQGGLIVHVGCGDGKLTGALASDEHFLVQGLDAKGANVEQARRYLASLGRYGKVSAEQFDGSRLPYVDNLVNLLVVSDANCQLAEEEIRRVLAPGGAAIALDPQAGVYKRAFTKPWPKEIDEWTHYLHGPDNNAVAQDTVVGPPQHYQWLGTPDYLRHHDHMSGLSAMVSAKGRLFYIMDLGPRWSVAMPPQWTLIARDAFNGVILWQRPITKWHPHLWPLKNGPAEILRRLVAQGDTLYATLGVGEPVVALDAASGRTLRSYEGTRGAEEILVSDGILLALVNPELDAYQSIPRESVDAIRGAGRQWNWDERPRRLVAAEAATGKLLWSKESRVAPGTPAAADKRVYFHDGDRVVCLDRQTGSLIWSSPPLPRWKPLHVMFNPTLIIAEDVVLFAGGENMTPHNGGKDTMTALSAKTGQILWTAPHPPSGYASSEDLFVIGGLVWCGVTSSPRDSGVFTGRDLHTGEVRREFPPDDWKHMPHHRCYRAKATCNYILTSRTGIEFVDLQAEHWTADHWVRGSCNYGVLPCNGLIYAPPHSCACYLLAKLNGLSALAPASPTRQVPEKIPDEDRLEYGPAYPSNPQSPTVNPSIPQSATPNSSDWPTYRHDAARSGVTKTTVPAELNLLWETELGGRLSSAVVAEQRVYVASIDNHSLHAIDAVSGQRLWSYRAGGRIDSPPTIWRQRVLFGSADGHVYCLRAEDGRLVWRFRAAPLDRRLMAQEQVESVWPVHGSVLLRDGVVYAVAGRAMWLDGGLRLLRLDASTGRKLSETVLDDKYPGTQDTLQKDVKWPNLPVALPDVLSCDDRYLYMRSQPFHFDGQRSEVVTPRDYRQQRGETAHLFSPTGFLDDSWWHRSYWMWGRSYISAAGGWQLATYQAPAGSILVADESSIYGFGAAPLRFLGTPRSYHLFACSKEPKIINPNPHQAPRKQGTAVFGEVVATRLGYDWSESTPLLARAMVLADQALFVAGPPVLVDEQDLEDHYGDPAVQAKAAEQVAAFAGRKGGLLLAVSRSGGRRLAAYTLASPPVFDGLIAAGGRLFLSTLDGKVLCLGSGAGQPLLPRPDAKVQPLPASTSSATRARAKTIQPTLSHPDFQQLTAVRIESSDLGYRVQTSAGSTGLALRKLAQPLSKEASFHVKARSTPGAPSPDTPGNAFVVFGDAPEEGKLVECGFRISGKVLCIAQASTTSQGRNTSAKAELRANEVTDLDVVVDLVRQEVTLSARGQRVHTSLERRIDSITWIGYCVHSVAADFGPLEVGGQ